MIKNKVAFEIGSTCEKESLNSPIWTQSWNSPTWTQSWNSPTWTQSL